MRATSTAVGCDGKESDMTTTARGAPAPAVSSGASPAGIVSAALLGAVLIFFAGLAQSDALHDAAHDVRHATGFPCH